MVVSVTEVKRGVIVSSNKSRLCDISKLLGKDGAIRPWCYNDDYNEALSTLGRKVVRARGLRKYKLMRLQNPTAAYIRLPTVPWEDMVELIERQLYGEEGVFEFDGTVTSFIVAVPRFLSWPRLFRVDLRWRTGSWQYANKPMDWWSIGRGWYIPDGTTVVVPDGTMTFV